MGECHGESRVREEHGGAIGQGIGKGWSGSEVRAAKWEGSLGIQRLGEGGQEFKANLSCVVHCCRRKERGDNTCV